MAARGAMAVLVAAALWACGCEEDNEVPRSFISGPRVLAIKAEPPELGPGQSSTVTILVAGTQGQTPSVSWNLCLLAPLPGQASNPDCVTNPQASYIVPLGAGDTVTATMPADTTAEDLGQPDASGGVYLTLVANVTVGTQSFAAVYRLRFGAGGASGNHNPTLTGVTATSASGTTSLDEASPLTVREGDQLTLASMLAAGSAEVYTAPVVGMSGGLVMESPRTSWFATAGDFSADRTDADTATVLSLDQRLPAPGTIIDVYAVVHEERGGVDYLHRTLRLE